jgi:hypothetical protein
LVESAGLNILLVHGTWGRGFWPCCRTRMARWCKPDSDFVKGLREALLLEVPEADLSISRFNWSGANSVFERERAARRLARLLTELDGDTRQTLIIAHSHGGNVALKSITIRGDAAKIHVCTLATPFLSIFEVRRFLPRSPIIFFVLCGIIVGTTHYIAFPYSLFDRYDVPYFTVWLPAFFSGTTVAGWWLERVLVNNPLGDLDYPAWWKRWVISPEWEQRPERLAEATATDSKLFTGRLLVLRRGCTFSSDGRGDKPSDKIHIQIFCWNSAWIDRRRRISRFDKSS